ncbi:hypothetical protein [Candidatus Stoquefichus sp. SB1]|uniref:hypothetical protein n=1 Tax=Candidatus Stoquefichus sp. SB1 TaxID=1658109 RepID=UPI00067F2D41|nr:hypothetical protein [Candidatus Stoquefichus sp. SB1]
MKKYTIKDFINKDLVFVGNYIEAKNMAKALKEEGIDTTVIDRIVRANDTKFVLFVRKNILVLAFDINLIIITECDSNAEVIHYDDLVVQDHVSKNEIHVSEFVKGNVAIKFNRDNAIKTLKTLFANGFHFYSTADNEILEDMASHIDYVTNEERTCIMDVFFLPVAKNIIDNSCVVYDKYSKSLKYDLDKEVESKGQELINIDSIDFGPYLPKQKFNIKETVYVKDDRCSYIGLIVSIDDINNEYEVAYYINGHHETSWVEEKYIFKIDGHGNYE